MDSIARLNRLERGLAISLERIFGRYDSSPPATVLRGLEEAEREGLGWANWADVPRLLEAIEAVERDLGIQHVRVRSESRVDRLIELHTMEPVAALELAHRLEETYPGISEDVSHWPRIAASGVCPSCGGLGRWGDDIPCGRCEGRGV